MRPVLAFPRRTKAVTRALAVLALACGLSVAAVAPASAHTATAGTKPLPTAPTTVPIGRTFVPKPTTNIGSRTVHPAIPWTLTLTASANNTWPTEYSTLTATANTDVGPTAYFIEIYDTYTDTLVAACGSGTTCAVALTYPTATDHSYIAYVASYGSYPPANVQAESGSTYVDWQYVGPVGLSATGYAASLGQNITITATTTVDVLPTPFYIQIWDTTTTPAVLVGACGSGTTCSGIVAHSTAGTHSYVATVAASSTSYPPPSIQSTSPTDYVTWGGSWELSLTAPSRTYGSATITATANGDVGPTAYFIEIYNENTGALLDDCGFGSTCSFAFEPPVGLPTYLVAFIATYSSALPPPNIQASSNTASTFLLITQ
jgi:hypothetical protein